jgi:hypothetical protein
MTHANDLDEKLNALLDERKRVQNSIISLQYETTMLGLHRRKGSTEAIAINTFAIKKNRQRVMDIQEEISVTKKMIAASRNSLKVSRDKTKYKMFLLVAKDILPKTMYEMVLEETARRMDGGE